MDAACGIGTQALALAAKGACSSFNLLRLSSYLLQDAIDVQHASAADPAYRRAMDSESLGTYRWKLHDGIAIA